ncbi:rod shape-determining protein MreC [Desulfovibrio sp. OttesenSCG-928-O18]|nr:rod shape-determining protein MreC [Desulfovibrio sp. OttesenSCG-928-O18]
MWGIIFALCAFLALYTWNARTGYLDTLTEHSGLEVTGYLLLPATLIKTKVTNLWDQYVALVDVAEENRRLREEQNRTEQYLALVRDDLAELARLRNLVGLKPPEQWNALGTRVLAGRFGPGASLETIMIDRGFATGAAPGTPLATHQGLVGRVYRASPHIATVLLLTDQTFRAAVVTSEGRVPGVLVGGGPRANLEVRYMAPNAKVNVGETLITSGLDDTFPKGLPVARIISVEPGTETLFQQVQAEPLASPDALEEALLLIAPDDWPINVALPDILPSPRAPSPAPAETPVTGAVAAPSPAQPAARPQQTRQPGR